MINEKLKRVLTLRLAAARSSVTKYQAMINRGTGRESNVLKHTVQFNGAHTGRSAGRGVQTQNLFKSKLKTEQEIEAVANKLKRLAKNPEAIDALEVFQDAANCLRSAIIARPGKVLLVGDYSNIEGRGSAWLSQEEWKLKAFREFDAGVGKDLYVLTYARAFNEPVESVDDEKRFIGKTIELACQYQGWVDAIRKGLRERAKEFTEDQLWEFAMAWRKANPALAGIKIGGEVIKEGFWAMLEGALMKVTRTGKPLKYLNMLKVSKEGDFLKLTLPNGRSLCYYKPTIKRITRTFYDRKGKKKFKTKTMDSLFYYGPDPITGKMIWINLYAGRTHENLNQALCACIIKQAIQNISKTKEYQRGQVMPLFNAHDELVVEADKGIPLEYLFENMLAMPDIYKGLPMAAKGFVADRYRKG